MASPTDNQIQVDYVKTPIQFEPNSILGFDRDSPLRALSSEDKTKYIMHLLENLQEQGFITPVPSTESKPPDIGLHLALAFGPVPTSDPKPPDISRHPELDGQPYNFMENPGSGAFIFGPYADLQKG